jgi:hypothetical protein
MFCPECAAEYVTDITKCPECNVKLVPNPPKPEQPKYIEWTCVYEHRYAGQVAMAESLLQSENIEYVVRDQNTIYAELVAPVKLCVKPQDASRAKKLLDEL